MRYEVLAWKGNEAARPFEQILHGKVWTAHKVFRRFLEHEREHLSHIEEVLEEYRTHRR